MRSLTILSSRVLVEIERVPTKRMTPEALADAWCALREGRWTVVDSVLHDGRRVLVARPAPGAQGAAAAAAPAEPGRLSAQERRAVVALALGHANKHIAYDLGVAVSTVSTLLARAARKLGCTSRVELTRAGRALQREADLQRVGEAA